MKLCICPICGSKDIDKPVKTVESLCWECGNFIIPLATPQVCIHSTEDSYKEASLYTPQEVR